MARKVGLEFAPIEIDAATNDEKLFVLLMKAEDPSAEFGRWVLLLGQIYGNGWALQLDERKALLVAKKTFCDSVDDLLAFIGRCVDENIFDRGLWERERVLTSKGIQERFITAKKLKRERLQGPWVLLSEISENFGESSENSRDFPKNPEPYIREEEDKRRELKEEEEDKASSSSSENVENSDCPLPCMASKNGQTRYEDAKGELHDSKLLAIKASYVVKFGRRGLEDYCSNIAKLCPHGCRGDPKQSCECAEIVLRALDRFDPALGHDPWPLTRKMLSEDRSFGDGKEGFA